MRSFTSSSKDFSLKLELAIKSKVIADELLVNGFIKAKNIS
jgi:hypothetical protein